MSAMESVNYGSLRIIAHATGTQGHQPERRLNDRLRPDFQRSGRLQNLVGAILKPRDKFEIIRMVLVSATNGRTTPRVLQFRIKRYAVSLDRERRPMETQMTRASRVSRMAVTATTSRSRFEWSRLLQSRHED